VPNPLQERRSSPVVVPETTVKKCNLSLSQISLFIVFVGTAPVMRTSESK
jgi:hypothetical protein